MMLFSFTASSTSAICFGRPTPPPFFSLTNVRQADETAPVRQHRTTDLAIAGARPFERFEESRFGLFPVPSRGLMTKTRIARTEEVRMFGTSRFNRNSKRMSNRPRTRALYFNPACASISRNCLRVRMSIDWATSFPLRSYTKVLGIPSIWKSSFTFRPGSSRMG